MMQGYLITKMHSLLVKTFFQLDLERLVYLALAAWRSV